MVIPTSISAKGNVVAVIQYLKGEEVIYSYEAFGKGGKIGTFTNLVGDGMDSLAKIISKELKKFAVAKKI